MRYLIVMLLFATLACSLSNESSNSIPSPTALPLLVSTQTPTLSVTASPTARLNATPTQSGNTSSIGGNGGAQPAQLPPTVTNCTSRTDWVTYTVKAGDSLSVIAASVNSNVNELVSANCLANPNSIVVGQVLHLPRAVGSTTGNNTTGNNTTSTSNNTTGNSTTGNNTTGNTTTGNNTSTGNNTTTTNLPVFATALSAKPVITVNGSLVSLQQTIALDAGVVSDAYQVDYYAGLSANDSAPVKIGGDSDPFDGTQITYDFNPFDETLYFWAIAINEHGNSKSTVLTVTYDPDYNPNATGSNSAVTAAPYLGFDGSVYTLQHGATIAINWPTAPTNASRVDFYLTPTGGGSSLLIGSDPAPSDGASIPWIVPEWVLGQLSAQAVFSNSTTSQSLALYIYSEGTGARPGD